MDLEFKHLPFEVKATNDDGSTGEGHASVFYNIDAYQEIVDDRAFADDLPAFLADGFVGGLNHNWDDPIGRPTKAETDDVGLHVGWKISDTQHGRDVRTLLRDGVIRKLSIGYRTLGRQELESADEVLAYWQAKGYTPNAEDLARAAKGATLLTRLRLFEFSPVTMPANQMASITRVKSEDFDAIQSLADMEEFLRDAGRFSRRDAKAILSQMKTLLRDAESGDTDVPDAPADDAAPTPPDAETKDGETPPADPPRTLVALAPPVFEDVAPSDPVPPALMGKRRKLASDLYRQFLTIQGAR